MFYYSVSEPQWVKTNTKYEEKLECQISFKSCRI